MTKNEYAVGQRWISESEPDLGLGVVVQVDKGRVQILFPAPDESRIYATSSAPLKRVRFKVGDKITTQDNTLVTVEAITEENQLLVYTGEGVEIPEALLSHSISFHAAEDRLLSGQIDPPGAFDLRRQTIALREYQRTSPVRGFIGGRIDLISHQLYIAHEVSSRYAPRVMLSDEVGLGKTIEACLIVHRMLLSGRASRILIVVPESLVHQWFVEMYRRFNLWLHIFDEERCEAIEAGAPDNNPFLDDQLIICSLEFLAGSQRRAAQAISAGWDMLVVDEAHHLTWSPEAPSIEYQVIELLGKNADGLLLLTATPEQLGLESHFARLRLLDPDRYEDLEAFQEESSAYQMIAGFVDSLMSGTMPAPDAITHVQERLHADTSTFEKQIVLAIKDDTAREQLVSDLLDLHGPGRVLFRNTRAAMSSFPSRVAHFVELLASDEAYLQQLRLEFTADIDEQKKQPHYTFETDERLSWLIDFLQQHAEEKVLLICRTKEKALALHDAFRKRVNISAGIFHEDLTLVQRDRNAAWFADPEGARLLICSEIGSEGRNFQFAHNLVLFDLPPNPELLEQRIGRLDRIGQSKDIQIHIPFVKGSPQQLMARWYHEGLDAFERNLAGTDETLRALGVALLAQAMQETPANIDALLDQANEAQSALRQRLHDGRDRLLERNAHRPAVSKKIIQEIKREDASPALEQFMLAVFDYAGILAEDLADRTYYLNPEHMLIDAFPGIPEDGISITFDRKRALEREEIAFASWDHPIVTGAIDVVLGVEKGNSSFGVLESEEDNDILLETIFVLEPTASKSLHTDRFMPAALIRVLVNRACDNRSTVWPADKLARSIRRGNPTRLLDNSLITQQIIPDMLEAARLIAQQQADERINQTVDEIRVTLQHEIQRMRQLQQINGNVRPEEIETAIAHESALVNAIQDARLRLDAVRLIWHGPGGMF